MFSSFATFPSNDENQSPTRFGIAMTSQAFKKEAPKAYASLKNNKKIYSYKGPLAMLTRQEDIPTRQKQHPTNTQEDIQEDIKEEIEEYTRKATVRHHTIFLRLEPFCKKFKNCEDMSKKLSQTGNQLIAQFNEYVDNIKMGIVDKGQEPHAAISMPVS